jgi:nucleotide sugar dehydrogenase
MNIGVIGVGKLGLAYALVLEQKGFSVIASSYKADYVDQLKNKTINTPEPGINELLSNSQIDFTVDNHYVIDKCDFIYIMVATPSNPEGDYDVTAVKEVAKDFVKHTGPVEGKIVVVGSTVNPGTCEELQKILDPLKVHVVYCPTFVAQGSVIRDMMNPHALLIGTTNKLVANICQDVFVKVCKEGTPVCVMSPKAAEVMKIAGNCKATMNITYANSIGQIMAQSDLNDELESATKFLSLVKATSVNVRGFGFGGPCFPRDNRAMVHYAQKIGANYDLGTAIDDANHTHVEYLVNYFTKRNINKLPFYFEYVSYKKGVNIFEESHQLKVCKKLLNAGATVYVEDTEFLTPEIKSELTEMSKDVTFITLSTINEEVFNVHKEF